jgi:hypothetical protein
MTPIWSPLELNQRLGGEMPASNQMRFSMAIPIYHSGILLHLVIKGYVMRNGVACETISYFMVSQIVGYDLVGDHQGLKNYSKCSCIH